jgi:hypothetical protein
MQKTIHGADDLIISSKSDSKERPPILEQEEAPSDEDEDTEPRLNTMATGASKENHDGLHWLDGPSPTLDNVERRVFTIEDTIDVGSSYLFDLLDTTSPTAAMIRGQHMHRAQVQPPPICTTPKEVDWSIW